MMVLLVVFARDYILPIINKQKSIFELEPFVYSAPPDFDADIKQDYFLDMRTNFGTVTFDLFEKSTPFNVNNLAFLAGRNYYDGTKFHRLMPDFLLQGGDRNTLDDDLGNDGRGGPGYFIEDEVNWDSLDLPEAKRSELQAKGYTSEIGVESVALGSFTLAMASSLPDTNGSQFFILLADPSDPRLEQLNGYFTVVGRVFSGADVLERIRQVPVDDATSANPRPTQDIILEDFTVYTK